MSQVYQSSNIYQSLANALQTLKKHPQCNLRADDILKILSFFNDQLPVSFKEYEHEIQMHINGHIKVYRKIGDTYTLYVNKIDINNQKIGDDTIVKVSLETPQKDTVVRKTIRRMKRKRKT